MIRKLLWPLSFLWGAIYSFRRFAYRVEIFSSKKFKVPVISVGNLSFGGTNKTPFTLFLSQILKHKKVTILMRGYKSKLESKGGLLQENTSENPVLDFGDEATLFIGSNPDLDIIVGKNRAQNLEKYYPKINSDVILLDDGFQHLKIKRDLDIVLLDSTMDLSLYKTFPLGYLRENLSALSDADIIVYTRCDQVNDKKLTALKSLVLPHLQHGVVHLETALVPLGVFNFKREMEMDLNSLAGKKVHAFCGIGNPKTFFSSLENLGAVIEKKTIFRDHHFFSDKELARMLKESKSEDTIFITTEKDFVRISKDFKKGRIFYLGTQIKVLKGFEEFEKKIRLLLPT